MRLEMVGSDQREINGKRNETVIFRSGLSPWVCEECLCSSVSGSSLVSLPYSSGVMGEVHRQGCCRGPAAEQCKKAMFDKPFEDLQASYDIWEIL
jgi:hypothetical protein